MPGTALAPDDEAARTQHLLKRFATDHRFRIENMFKILDARTRKLIPLHFNEAQIILDNKYKWFRERRMPARIVICKARRAGLSTGVEAIITDDSMTTPNTQSLIVANQTNPSENVLAMCTTMWRHMPAYFEMGGHRIQVRPHLPPEFNNNPPRDKLFFAEPLNSKIWVATAKSIDAYLGYGFQNMHATEAAYYADAHELFRALYPTLSTDPHSALFIESTPNGQEGKGAWFYEQCMDAGARKKTQYGEMALVFIPWHEMRYSFSIPFRSPEKKAAFEKSLTAAERDVIKRWGVDLEQIQWRRMMLSGPTFNQDEDIFDQEYPSDLATAFLVTGKSVFGRKDIKRLIARAREPEWEGDVYFGNKPTDRDTQPVPDLVRRPSLLTKGQARARGFPSHVNEGTYNNLKLWRKPKRGERIYVSSDIGGGSRTTKDGDYTVAFIGVLNDYGPDEIIGKWKGHINPIAWAEVASALMWWLAYRVGDEVGLPEFVPEWTGPGTGCVTEIDHHHLYPEVYRYQQPGIKGLPKSKHLGWESNAKTKPIMVGYTIRMVEQDLIDIPDAECITQMASYVKKDDFGDVGSYGGAAGRHDDDVSALQILCAILRIRSTAYPGEQDVETVNMESDDYGANGDLPDFDPFRHDDPLPYGLTEGDLGGDNLEEAAWWAA